MEKKYSSDFQIKISYMPFSTVVILIFVSNWASDIVLIES